MSSLSRRCMLATAAASFARPTAADTLVTPQMRVPDGVALTLDACPGGFDARIGHALVEAAIPATIFITAVWIRWNPHAIAFLLAQPALFQLENHGACHIPAVLGSTKIYGLAPAGTLEAVAREVTDGAAAVTAATQRAPVWYRDATARYSPAAIDQVHRLGYTVAGYSLNADEGASLAAPSVAARVGRARPGDVIIGHINQPHRPSGAGIIDGVLALHRQGMKFVHLPPEG